MTTGIVRSHDISFQSHLETGTGMIRSSVRGRIRPATKVQPLLGIGEPSSYDLAFQTPYDREVQSMRATGRARGNQIMPRNKIGPLMGLEPPNQDQPFPTGGPGPVRPSSTPALRCQECWGPCKDPTNLVPIDVSTYSSHYINRKLVEPTGLVPGSTLDSKAVQAARNSTGTDTCPHGNKATGAPSTGAQSGNPFLGLAKACIVFGQLKKFFTIVVRGLTQSVTACLANELGKP